MAIQFLTHFVVQHSLESQKGKTAMAESKPQISDYIQVERKTIPSYSLLTHSNTSLWIWRADYSPGGPLKRTMLQSRWRV